MRRALLAALVLAACARPGPPPAAGLAERYAGRLARQPGSPVLRYDLGTALLLEHRYDDARAPLEAAVRVAPPALRARALYNLGNADLEPAFAADTAEQGRVDRLRRAVAAYRAALRLAPADGDARWNLELAERLLREAPEHPRQSPQGGGSGGGQGGGGGGGGGQAPQPARQSPQPQGGAEGGESPRLSPEAAERLLASAREQELGVQRDKLAKPQPDEPMAH